MSLLIQIGWLLVLGLPVACIAWTVTHEEVFRELQEFSKRKVAKGSSFFTRKFFYLFTCEYCFSHYVAILFLFITRYKLLFTDWRGYVVAGFSLVWIANVYMNLYSLIRVDLRLEKLSADLTEQEIKK